MYVTKAIAEKVAETMIQPITKRIKEKKLEMENLADEIVNRETPKDVMNCFKLYRSYFNKSGLITLSNQGQTVQVNCSERPSKGGWVETLMCSQQESERLELMELELRDLRDDKKKTQTSIESTLLSLKTFKRVKENFPEAYEHMREYEESPKAVLMLPVDTIMETLKKFE